MAIDNDVTYDVCLFHRTEETPEANDDPEHPAVSVEDLSPLAVRTQQPVLSREDIDGILANLEPLKCSRRKLRQVMCMIVVRVRDQEKLITTQRSHLEQGASVITRLTAQQQKRQSRVDKKSSKIDTMEVEANNIRQKIREFQGTVKLMKGRLLTEDQLNNDLTSQNKLLSEQIATLTKNERTRGIGGATAKEHQTAKNAYLREKKKHEELKKRLERYKKLYTVLTDLKADRTPAEGDKERSFEISFVERNGQTEVTCKKVPHGKQVKRQPCGHLVFSNDGNGDSQGIPTEGEANEFYVGKLEVKEEGVDTSVKDADFGNRAEGDSSPHVHVSTPVHSGATDVTTE